MTKITSKKNMKMAGDLIYTVMGTVVMNVALQIIIYPIITHKFGEGVTDKILYFIGLIYVIPQAFGGALSNSRLVIRKEVDASNSDYKMAIMICSALTAISCGAIGLWDEFDPLFALGYGAFSVVYLLRMYAQVEFRLTLKFKEYFFYFCIISVGYLLGLGLYLLTNVWILVFATGEVAAVCYSFFKGGIFKSDSRKCSGKLVGKSVAMIAVSTLARDCVLQFDKVMLKQLGDEGAATHYHVVSLLAKTMQMLISPINTLILSYLTVKDAKLSKNVLAKFFVASIVIGAVFYGVCIIGTPIYIKIFYSKLYDEIIGYNYIVNLGLIIGFLASLFMALLLSQGKTSIHTAIECIYGVIYVAVAYCFINQSGIMGLAWVTLAMNTVKMLFTVVYLFFIVGKNSEKRVATTEV